VRRSRRSCLRSSPRRAWLPRSRSGKREPADDLRNGGRRENTDGNPRHLEQQPDRLRLHLWRRCASDGFSCVNIVDATNLSYTLKNVDVGHTLRFRVVAINADGQTAALSAPTAVVQNAAVVTTTTTTTTTTAPPPAINHRPSIRMLAVRFIGLRVYVRMRVCDDSHRRMTIIERDSRRGASSYIRRFRTLTAPAPCSTLTRSWRPAPRFRHRLTITVWARDFAGLTSRPASRSFTR
jgi:hypothetical protein